jgi:hypothetical protein
MVLQQILQNEVGSFIFTKAFTQPFLNHDGYTGFQIGQYAEGIVEQAV